jgi:hypothetical protein
MIWSKEELVFPALDNRLSIIKRGGNLLVVVCGTAKYFLIELPISTNVGVVTLPWTR